jgi:proline dehydrogenase
LRTSLLRASTNPHLEHVVASSRPARPVARRFTASTGRTEVLAVADRLAAQGLSATIDYLGEDCDDQLEADRATPTDIGLVRTDERRRLARREHRARGYLPWGRTWCGNAYRRIAERPANLVMLSRAARREVTRGW